ncbi:MAG: 2-hydroxyacyl-CoA dehydratase family protein [Deltaproteobacteria bacterium]|nr:2-hydroxyacyl-CoA dehydratase family protein [Deltaproteobacteria bacterium]
MKNHFLSLDEASRNPDRKVAWCTSVGPAEILRAMDFEVYFPENHGALLGATRTTEKTIPLADSRGYSQDICSYLRSDIGAYLQGFTPLERAYGIKSVPKPDVLVYCTNQCKDVMHWFEFFSRQYQAPIFGIHPPTNLPEIQQSHIRDVTDQYKELILFLEEITHSKIKPDRLAQAVKLSKEATDLWADVLGLCRNSPSPFDFFDATISMGPIVVLRGTEIAKDFYQKLYSEITAQIARQGSDNQERFRLYWDGMPVWGRLRSLSGLFDNHHASIVASTYCNSWIFSDFNPEKPLESMALAYLKIFINRNDHYKEEYILNIIEEFNIDGVVFHNAKTCPNNTNIHYNLPNRLRSKGIKSVVIDGDLNDLRCFSDEQSANRIEAFLEILE